MLNKELIYKLAEIELAEANTKHPELFASPHEAYAVIKEELEETDEELTRCRGYINAMWSGIKQDDVKMTNDMLELLEQHSWQCVAEAVQILSMCIKMRVFPED